LSVGFNGLSFSWSADGSEYSHVGRPAMVVKEELASKGDDENSGRAILARSSARAEDRLERPEVGHRSAASFSPDGSTLLIS